MADDLDDFLSELGISKTGEAAPLTAVPATATTNADPNEFLDWLNEPTSTEAAAPVSEVKTEESQQPVSKIDETPAKRDFSSAFDQSFVSEPPTPPKLEALPLPALDEVIESPEKPANEATEFEPAPVEKLVTDADDLGLSSNAETKTQDDFGFEVTASSLAPAVEPSFNSEPVQEQHSEHAAPSFVAFESVAAAEPRTESMPADEDFAAFSAVETATSAQLELEPGTNESHQVIQSLEPQSEERTETEVTALSHPADEPLTLEPSMSSEHEKVEPSENNFNANNEENLADGNSIEPSETSEPAKIESIPSKEVFGFDESTAATFEPSPVPQDDSEAFGFDLPPSEAVGSESAPQISEDEMGSFEPSASSVHAKIEPVNSRDEMEIAQEADTTPADEIVPSVDDKKVEPPSETSTSERVEFVAFEDANPSVEGTDMADLGFKANEEIHTVQDSGQDDLTFEAGEESRVVTEEIDKDKSTPIQPVLSFDLEPQKSEEPGFNESVQEPQFEFGEGSVQNQDFGFGDESVQKQEFGFGDESVQNQDFGFGDDSVHKQEFGFVDDSVGKHEFGFGDGSAPKKEESTVNVENQPQAQQSTENLAAQVHPDEEPSLSDQPPVEFKPAVSNTLQFEDDFTFDVPKDQVSSIESELDFQQAGRKPQESELDVAPQKSLNRSEDDFVFGTSAAAEDDFTYEAQNQDTPPRSRMFGETEFQTGAQQRTPPPPRLDLSFNDLASPEYERRASKTSLGSVPPTPTGSNLGFNAAPLSSVRPIPPAERLALWTAALKAFQKPRRTSSIGSKEEVDTAEDDDEEDSDEFVPDQSVCPKALEVLDSISTSKFQGSKLVFALRRVWGAALSVKSLGFADPHDYIVSERTGSLLRALFGYHDPELTLHLDQVTSFTWCRSPFLFGFYAGKHDACLELWDLGIVKVHPGFETPQSGSMFFAFGVCTSRRAHLMQCSALDEVFAVFEEANTSMRQSHEEAARWAIFSSRIARETPRTFRNVVAQCEMDLSSLQDFPVFEDGTSEEYEEVKPEENDMNASDFQLEADEPETSLVHRSSVEDDRRSVQSGHSESAKKVDAVPQLFDNLKSSSASGGGWSKWKELAIKTTKQLSEKLAGPIDSEEVKQLRHEQNALAKQPKRIRLVVLDQNHLGCKLSLTKAGLMCVGFPESGAGRQLERKGVKEGDLIHAINGATVLSLPPSTAELVAQKQERPLFVTVGTSNMAPFELKRLNKERFAEAKKVLLRPLSEFYGRHGPSKVDRCEEILELYAGRERHLLNGLYEKYGEMVPGDELMRCESGAAVVTADEIVDYLEHPDDKDHLLVDIRDITERADTGYFAASVLYGHADVVERLREAKRTYLIGSGRGRELSIADPIRAKAEARLDLERTKIIVDRLWREGVKRVSIVLGGYAQVAKELKQREVEVNIISQGSGTDFRLLDLYLRLDFEDPHSVANYLTSHCAGAKGRRSSSVVSEGEHASIAAASNTHQTSVTGSLTRRPSVGSNHSSKMANDASSQLATEEDEQDDILPTPPNQTSAAAAAAASATASAVSAATAKAANAAAKDLAAMASNWSKWYQTKRKQGE